MKIFNKLILFCVLNLCCLTSVHAFDGMNCGESKICSVDQIITNEQGVFLLVDGFWLGSQSMQAVPDGILVLENGEWTTLEEAVRCDNYYVWKCRKCGKYSPQGANRCQFCGTPRGG